MLPPFAKPSSPFFRKMGEMGEKRETGGIFQCHLHLSALASSPSKLTDRGGGDAPSPGLVLAGPGRAGSQGTPAGFTHPVTSVPALLSIAFFFTPPGQSTRQMIYVHGSDLLLLAVPRQRRGLCPVPWDAAGWQRGRSGPELTCGGEAWHVHAGLCRAGILDFSFPEASPETCLNFSCNR